MKKNLLSKNIHQWLLLLVCFVGTLPLWAEDYPKDGIIYDINTSTNTATVKGLEDKSATSAKIRNRVAGCEVTSIGNGAFFNCSSLTSINIPSSVTSIGESAFSYCYSLTTINIPSSVTSIKRSAFSGCSSLTSINIPSSVTSIGGSAFSGCSSLTAFTVDTNNPNYCAEGCILFNKEKTTLICASGSQRTYDIPSSVTSIGGYAFSDCSSLTSINIPNSVTSIGRAAFSGCSSLTSINIPNYVTSIEGFAFNDCSSLTSINIPSSVTSIEECAFQNCFKLQQIMLPCTDVKTATMLYKAMNNPQRKFVVPDDCEALKPLLTQHKNMVAASTILPRPKRRVADMVFKPFAAVDVNTPLWQLTYDALRGLAMMQRLSVNAERETLSNYEKAVLVLPGIDEFRINFSRCYTENDTLACLESSIACRSHEQEVASFIKRELTEKLDYNMKDLSNKRKGAAMFTKFGTQNTIFVIPDPDWERVFLLNVHTGTDCYERVISRFDK